MKPLVYDIENLKYFYIKENVNDSTVRKP